MSQEPWPDDSWIDPRLMNYLEVKVKTAMLHGLGPDDSWVDPELRKYHVTQRALKHRNDWLRSKINEVLNEYKTNKEIASLLINIEPLPVVEAMVCSSWALAELGKKIKEVGLLQKDNQKLQNLINETVKKFGTHAGIRAWHESMKAGPPPADWDQPPG